MSDNYFKIIVGYTTADSQILLNGEPLHGVRHVSFDLDADHGFTRLHLTIEGAIEVDGEFLPKDVLVIKSDMALRKKG